MKRSNNKGGEGQKSVYFLSDLHLGVDGRYTSREREVRVCRLLRSVADDIGHLYLVGDIFDHWYEWREAVPRGFVRWFGVLAELRDAGVPITAFTGNHDVWLFDYLQEELDIVVERKPLAVEHFGRRLLIGHGDGLGPGDTGYKLLKKVFTNPLAQWLYSRLHPNFALRLMRSSSHTSRKYGDYEGQFIAEQEWLVAYAERKIQSTPYDYLVFGHRHLPIRYPLSNGTSTYINLGEWLSFETYGVLTPQGFDLLYYDNPNGIIYGS